MLKALHKQLISHVCFQVVDWILGAAEKLLSSQNEIGDSFKTADELRKRHEQLELKCMVQ